MGPAYWGLQALTFFRNLSIPIGVKGTPKSGQLVKWNWVMRRWGFFPETSPTWDTNNTHNKVNQNIYKKKNTQQISQYVQNRLYTDKPGMETYSDNKLQNNE